VQIRALIGSAFINAINCGNELILAVYAISIPSFAAVRRYDRALPFLQMRYRLLLAFILLAHLRHTIPYVKEGRKELCCFQIRSRKENRIS
jgi:hypothetical protein